MKKIIFYSLLGVMPFTAQATTVDSDSYSSTLTSTSQRTSVAATEFVPLGESSHVETCGTVLVSSHKDLPALWNGLKPEERVLAYYLYRAFLPMNQIALDQTHRDGILLFNVFYTIVAHKQDLLAGEHDFNVREFLDQAAQYLVFLRVNRGMYHRWKQEHNKTTPSQLGLNLLTRDNIIRALDAIGVEDGDTIIEELAPTLFDSEHEYTLTKDGDIEGSAINIYSKDFTTADYDSLPELERKQINRYFFIEMTPDGIRVPRSIAYKVGGKYSDELSVTVAWLKLARDHVKRHIKTFSPHAWAALKHLIAYFETGVEALFDAFSIEWAQSQDKMGFNAGFIEVYADPKAVRGETTAEVTVEAIDMSKLRRLLPVLESRLPLPSEMKRAGLEDGSATFPNFSICMQLFGAAHYGPIQATAAYCLPNNGDMRSITGARQIQYKTGESIMRKLKPALIRQLLSTADREWEDKYDPDLALARAIDALSTTLHETLGHGSGRLTTHTFVTGDNLTIGGVTYKVGDKIDVTFDNIKELMGEKYYSYLEELRAETSALYSGVAYYDDLIAIGLLPSNDRYDLKRDKAMIVDKYIINTVEAALWRLYHQKEDATEVSGTYPQMSGTIFNYLLDHGGLEVVEEVRTVDGEDFTILSIQITDRNLVIRNIKELMVKVQTIKATGDGQGARKLLERYGKRLRSPAYISHMKKRINKVRGKIRLSASLYPDYTPIVKGGKVVDVRALWPVGILSQIRKHQEQMLRTPIQSLPLS